VRSADPVAFFRGVKFGAGAILDLDPVEML
jgi:hypothetical protein